jgi:hypothetical protein
LILRYPQQVYRVAACMDFWPFCLGVPVNSDWVGLSSLDDSSLNIASSVKVLLSFVLIFPLLCGCRRRRRDNLKEF